MELNPAEDPKAVIGQTQDSTLLQARSGTHSSPNSELCSRCANISLSYGSTHHTLENLRKSARGGCACCRLIAETLTDCTQVGFTPAVKSELSPWRRNRDKSKKMHKWITDAGMTSEAWEDAPESAKNSAKNLSETGSSTEQKDEKRHYVARESSISVDSRRMLLFYTIYDCKTKGYARSNVLRRFELCKIRDSMEPASDTVTARLLENNPSSPRLFDLVSKWIENCSLEHRKCRQISSVLPTRVLDVSGDVPVLVDGEGRHAKYILLSHCWGTKQTLKTTRENINNMRRGISMESLPKTFHDAVIITKRLGIKFLWIDSLCIVQDVTRDWTSEAARMKDYYRNGHLTISALFSSDSHCGILNQRQDLSRVLLDPNRHLYLRVQPPEQRDVLRAAPLSSRAWVLQERLLSTRMLHYGDKEIFWECLTCTAREGSTIQSMERTDPDTVITSEGADFKRLLSNLDPDIYSLSAGAFATWYRLVTQYSRRALTYQSDRLPAISGLASQIQKETGATYLAGIWKEDIRSLLWILDLSVPLYDEVSKHSQDSTPYLAPSWSWVSAAGSVRYRYGKHVPSSMDAILLSYDLTHSVSEPMGEVTAGHLVLRAVAMDFSYQANEYWKQYPYLNPEPDFAVVNLRAEPDKEKTGSDYKYGTAGKGYMDHRVDTDEQKLITPTKKCKALWIMKQVSDAKLKRYGKMLEQVEYSQTLYCLLVEVAKIEAAEITWRRIGIGMVSICPEDWSEPEDFTLI